MKFIMIIIFTFASSLSLASQHLKKGLTFVTVGSDGCGFTTIQAAIDAGPDRIRVTQETFNENLTLFNQSIKIIGGYVNCSSAASDINLTGRTTINANNIATGLFISHNNTDDTSIELSNLKFEFGKAGDSDLAGGVLVHGNAQTNFELTNVIISDSDGSGLGLINVGSAILKDSKIEDNTDSNGGGIYSSNSDITVYGHSIIQSNTATNFGGGVYLTNASLFKMYSTSNFNSATGILFNVALKKGGGIYADLASTVFIISEKIELGIGYVGNNSSLVDIISNRAGDINNSGDGGAVYISGTNTVFTMHDGLIRHNSATGDGGGIAVENNANLIITHPPDYHCKNDTHCNEIYDNRAGIDNSLGGAISMKSGSTAFIGNTHFEENEADFGNAIYLLDANTEITVEGSSFYRNIAAGDRDGTYVIRGFTGTKATIAFSSFKNNNANTSTFGFYQADLTLAGVIVHDSTGTPVLSGSQSTVTNYCILAHDTSTLTGFNLIQSIPSPYVEASGNNIHLKSDTLAIDACDTSAYSPVFKDTDQQNRNFDTATPNLDGAYDMGADEYWADEIIFKDGFDIHIDI